MPFTEPPPPTCDYIAGFTPDYPHPIVAEWLAHVDAGRLGTSAPQSAAVRASVLAAEALVCRPPGRW